MPLTSFRIENQKAIRLAECQTVPPIMVIAGPNGVGKSTLLFCIKRRQGGTFQHSGIILYLPPHRAWRRRQIRLMHLWGVPQTYSNVLSSDSLGGVEGINVLDATRAPDSADEAISLVKYILSQIETRRQTAITISVDKNELRYPSGSVPDVYLPLKELTKILLPHLEFSRVDISARDNVKCLWKRASGVDLSHGTAIEIDIDELSSGEKSIVALFLPFIERQIEAIMQHLEGNIPTSAATQDLVVLIDEPELHLHPALQARMLDYLRQIVSKGGVQFIITTHSGTLLNAATDEELYLLTPKPDWPEPANQLIRLATSAERLEAMRILFGEIYPATACRAVVCLEGELPEDRSSTPADKRILEILCPDLMATVTLPMGGRNTVIEGARRLREVLPDNIPGLNVFAVIDRDQDSTEDNSNYDWIFVLPVCMLENLLLVPPAITKFLEPYIERIDLNNVANVESALRRIARGLRDDEIRLRVQRRLKPVHAFISGTSIENIKERHNLTVDSLRRSLPEDRELATIVTEATNEVDAILSNNEELKLFRGKEILNRFYKQYLQSLGFSYLTFYTELAKHVVQDTESTKPLKILVAHMFAFVPKDLETQVNNIKSLVSNSNLLPPPKLIPVLEQIDSILSRCSETSDERSDARVPRIDRIALRNDIITLARGIEESLGTNLNSLEELKKALGTIRLVAQKIGSF